MEFSYHAGTTPAEDKILMIEFTRAINSVRSQEISDFQISSHSQHQLEPGCVRYAGTAAPHVSHISEIFGLVGLLQSLQSLQSLQHEEV